MAHMYVSKCLFSVTLMLELYLSESLIANNPYQCRRGSRECFAMLAAPLTSRDRFAAQLHPGPFRTAPAAHSTIGHFNFLIPSPPAKDKLFSCFHPNEKFSDDNKL